MLASLSCARTTAAGLARDATCSVADPRNARCLTSAKLPAENGSAKWKKERWHLSATVDRCHRSFFHFALPLSIFRCGFPVCASIFYFRASIFFFAIYLPVCTYTFYYELPSLRWPTPSVESMASQIVSKQSFSIIVMRRRSVNNCSRCDNCFNEQCVAKEGVMKSKKKFLGTRARNSARRRGGVGQSRLGIPPFKNSCN